MENAVHNNKHLIFYQIYFSFEFDTLQQNFLGMISESVIKLENSAAVSQNG